MKRNFVYQDGQSHKFWNIEINGQEYTVNYGKAGTQGQTQTKAFKSEAECQKAADKLIAEKVKKGYLEETPTVATSAATTTAEGTATSKATDGKPAITTMSYEDVLKKLKVKELFDYWNGDDDDYNDYSSNYDSEEEYFEDQDFLVCEGDLTIDENSALSQTGFLVVLGNLTINGKVPGYGDFQYYVTGNTTVDFLHLSAFQQTLGTETIRYVASVWAEDHEVVRTLPHRKVNAPYFFSWFYDLACFEFAPHTVITALYNYDELMAYDTDNIILRWHEFAYYFRKEFCYSIEESHHDSLDISPEEVYKALKNNQPVVREGVTAEAIRLVQQGIQLNKEEDGIAAYQCFKKAIASGPGYYPAYKQAGDSLSEADAYVQALDVYAKGIPHTPEIVLYEYSCMEEAAFCAVILKDYDKAIEYAQLALAHNSKASFSMRVIGEALIGENMLKEARLWLERSIDIKPIFTNNWLLGLIYHLEGDEATATEFFNKAKEKNAKAQPYSLHTNLHYIYGDNVTVDWDTRTGGQVKDEAYWQQFFTDMLSKYGPDMYEKTGMWPLSWLQQKIGLIPQQYRTPAMLQALLDHTTKGQPDVSGEIILTFDKAWYTPAILLQAIQRPNTLPYHYIPAELLTAEIYLNHPSGIDLQYVAPEQLTYELCFKAVSQSQYNYKFVPATFRDERMLIAYIAGGGLGEYSVQPLPSKYRELAYIQQAIDLHIHAIEKLSPTMVDKAVYDYAVSKYGQDPRWPFIVEKYDRDRWKYADTPDHLGDMGKLVQQFGIDVFEHVSVRRINTMTYPYYKKHLGHLPEFKERVTQYGWDEASKKTDPYEKQQEFTYDTFRKVWPCFWDEAFMIKALSRKEDHEHLYNVPVQYMTPAVCEAAVKTDGYALMVMPKHLITAPMCERAIQASYGSMLEYVPLELRTEALCRSAVGQSHENIKFTPLQHRQPSLMVSVLLRDMAYKNYIPREQYAATFELALDKFANRFVIEELQMEYGVGLLLLKQYEAARKWLQKAEASAEVTAETAHQALYYLGWSYFLEGDAANAQKWYKQAQQEAKSEKIASEDTLDEAYATFTLPDVPGVYEFNQGEFDKQMQEASLLVQTGSYHDALVLLEKTEQLLKNSHCSEMRLWAYVWDHQRYALYEAGKKEESLALCEQIIQTLSKITLWDYLEAFNSIRGTLRAAHNSLAYRIYETATDLAQLKEGLNHIKITMKTIAPIEDKSVLNYFYETQASLYHKAITFDTTYEKDLEKVMAKITKLKLKNEGVLSAEFIEKMGL